MKLKHIIFIFIFFLINVPAFSQPGFGKAENINENWKFILNDADNAEAISYNDDHWNNINLPYDWSVKQPLSSAHASSMGYLPGGIGWYRKNIHIPTSNQNKKVYFYFEGVYNRSDVYINGHHLGNRPNGYISFLYDATPYIKFGDKNVIAVRVDHSSPADSRWYTGAGIYRDVWLVYANPVHIAQWGVYAFPQMDRNTGIMHVNVELDNHSQQNANLKISNELINENGVTVANDVKNVSVSSKANKFSNKLRMLDPNLWSIDNPHLYKLHTKILKNNEVIDESITTTGFRTFTFDANNGFSLNGTNMKVKGVCLHHDAGVLGAAFYKEVWKRRLLALKELGCNAIRTSHNPQATGLYELCDELGFLVIDEAFDEWEYPKRKWLEGWNVGTSGYDGTYNFFKEWGKKDLADMVQRDRNHISIFAWSIGNEVDYPNDPYSHPVLDGSSSSGFTQKIFGGYKKEAPDAMRLGVIAKELVQVVKQYDTTRPTTAGLAGVAMSNETAYPGALDIAGYNYTESRYLSDHQKYPDRVIYGSENRHDLQAWKAVENNDHIFGQFLWTGIDYLGESGKWPSRGFYSGLIDFAGFIKPRGYYRQSLWSTKPMIYLGTYLISPNGDNSIQQDVLTASENKNIPVSIDAWSQWNYDESQMIRVVCYTNTHKPTLFLNNETVSIKRNFDEKTGIYYWDIPFKKGILSVKGFNKNNVNIANFELQTSGEPYSLKSIEKKTDFLDKNEIAQISIQIVDKKGIPVYSSENEITCTIQGNATLLGMEAGNNTDMGDYTDNKQKAYRGRLISYIKKNKTNERIKIKFTSAGLNPLEIIL